MYIILVPSLKAYVKILNYICKCIAYHVGFLGGAIIKKPPANAGDKTDSSSILGLEDPLGEEIATHSSILPGKFHGQRSLAGYSPRDRNESDTTEQTVYCVSNILQ